MASTNGCDSMSPTVPPISTSATSAPAAPSWMQGLDFVGDMRDHLHRGAEIVAAALLADDVFVHLAGGEIVALAERGAHEALVVAEVEVGLGTVLGDEHLAVLERAHGARIDVDVGVELEQRNLEATGFEDGGQGGGGDALAERGHNATGHEDIFGHAWPVPKLMG